MAAHRHWTLVHRDTRAMEHNRLRLPRPQPRYLGPIAIAVAFEAGSRGRLDVDDGALDRGEALGPRRLHSGYEHGSLRPAHKGIGTRGVRP